MKQVHKSDTDYKYEGITIHAAVGLHEYAIDLIQRTCRPNARILDMGCGSGAFTKRLQNHGFTTTSIDLSLDTFPLDSERHEIDLNADFAGRLSGSTFDAVVALEVIEHLENPLHFLSELRKIAGPAPVFISFPNVYLYWSLYSFFKNGWFAGWSPLLYWESGHQSMLTDWLFEAHLKKARFSLDEKHYCAPVEFPKNVKSLVLHTIFFKMVCLLSPSIPTAARKAESLLYVIRTEPGLSGKQCSAER